MAPLRQVAREALRDQLKIHSERCIRCGLCQQECKFLQKYGDPKQIADTYDPSSRTDQVMPFACSLCRLCAAVCPAEINPAAMFLEMRREAVARGVQGPSGHGRILHYEKRGTSRRYSYYALPANCDTVLFPGCTLPGTRPGRVRDLLAHLRGSIATLGLVLDCCTKPSRDLGREGHFQAMFNEMKAYLLQHGVKTVLVACPNCYRVFKEYGGALKVKTVYEHLAESSLPATATIPGTITVHDPCATRDEAQIQTAIRHLVESKGLTINEMPHHGARTLCCGEGGAVACIAPDYARGWGEKRKEEAAGVRILTYCAGCAHFLGAATPTSHVLDLLFAPEATMAGKAKISKAPWTYLNRLRLKSHFKKKIPAALSRERTFTGTDKGKGGLPKRIALLSALAAVIAALHLTGAAQYLEQEKLRAFIEGHGALAPIIYMLTYAVAPAFFLPGLPITVVGGILFGPFWGVVYSITGSTVGASIAFLISRYLGREWMEGKLRHQKWRQLETMVEEHGWKAVAFTRLIPLFPFNLLNYAFGLTRVKFVHYAVASFFCMLPACIAFIVFSSSLLDVIKGRVTHTFIAGILLMAAVSLLPLLYKKNILKTAEKSDRIIIGASEKEPENQVRKGCLKSVLKKKGVTLLAMLGITVIAALLVNRYFYFLDAYFYTYEFYWLFNVNNLHAANASLFAEYFKPMGIATEALPQLIFSHLVQNFYLPFTKPILVSVATSAFGFWLGSAFSFFAFIVVGILSFGLGAFFLGDIFPYLQNVVRLRNYDKLKKFQKNIASKTAIIFPLLFASPFIPISLVALSSAAVKNSFWQTAQFMVAGFLLRLSLLLVVTPFLFL